MAGWILVFCTAALAGLGVWLLVGTSTDDWCADCGQPRWYHADFWCDPPEES